MPSGTGTISLPFGPSTWSSLPMVTFTPFGSGIGFFPTRDIVSSLPKLAQHFAADSFLAGRRTGHDAARRGENVDAEPAQHPWNLAASDVHAAPRSRYALDARNHRHIARRVLQINADAALGAVFGQFEIGNKSFFLQNPRDLHFHLGGRHVDFGMARHLRIANARQHIADGIGCIHASSPFLTSSP